MISQQLPLPSLPDLKGLPDAAASALGSYLRDFQARLTAWISSVANAATAQVLWQVPLTPATGGLWTCPYTINTASDGTPQALVAADSAVAGVFQVVPATPTNPPPPGSWLLLQTAAGSTISQSIAFGTPPNTGAFCAFLVAR